MRETAPILAQKFEHAAVFYGSTAEYLDAVLGFVAAGWSVPTRYSSRYPARRSACCVTIWASRPAGSVSPT